MNDTPEPRPPPTSTLPTRPAGTRLAVPPEDAAGPLPVRVARPRPDATPFVPGTPAAKGNNTIWLAGAGTLILVILVASVMLALSPNDQATASVPLGQILQFDSQGNTHIAKGDPHPTYNSNPPNSGWHREEFPSDPTKFVYDQPLDDEVSVHLMEHGNLIAWYNCAAGADCTAIRDGLTQETRKVPADAPYRIYVMPRDSLPSGAHIALGAWQHIEYLSRFDQQKVDDFVQRFGARVQENMPAPTSKP